MSTTRVSTDIYGLAAWPENRKLRAWQRRALKEIRKSSRDSFLLEACPAAGKTLPSLRLAHQLTADGEVPQTIVLVPTTELAVQWAKEAASVGLRIEPNWQGSGPPRDCHGLAITYQRLAAMPELYRHLCANQPTLVIADEVHHMGLTAAWGKAYALAFEHSRFKLLLSGTPFRSDNEPIPGVTYDVAGRAQPDFSYTYPEAIQGGICRKIAFIQCDGELRWSSGASVIEANFGDRLDDRQSRLRHRTAISAVLDQGLRRMIAEADSRLTKVRENHPEPAGLIVANNIQHAQDIAAILKSDLAEQAVIVHSDEPRSAQLIESFRRGTGRWIVAVNMISEGVDIPRLRVGIYATMVKTPLFFRQVIGRFVRTTPGTPNDPSFLFLPADPILTKLSSEVEEEIRHELSAIVEAEAEGLSAEPDRSQDDFIPLSAQLSPVETVMSGQRFRYPDQAAAVETLARQLQTSPEDVIQKLELDSQSVLPPRTGETDFERRGRLRKERQRLVGILHHETGRSYEEIQQETNEATACSRPVASQTVIELERSVRHLMNLIASQRIPRHREAAYPTS